MEKEIIVVKYGSTSIANEQGIIWSNLDFFASQLAEESKRYGIVVVTSGAVALGRSKYLQKYPDDEVSDRIYAQMGAHGVYSAWERVCDGFDIPPIASLPITHHEIDDKEEGEEFVDALEENINNDVITFINQNDALSNYELLQLAHGSDNDGTALHTALTVCASELHLMTDTRGILRKERNKGYIKIVPADEDKQQAVFNHIDDTNSKGRGGMTSKVKVAIKAANAGIAAYISDAQTSFGAIRGTGKKQSSTKFEAKKHQARVK